uniref:snRNA-activating protein complex subunit 3 n=1 Tax=Timema californicum TaxID=61474 RepID=A0A7R9JEL0_TIMCA|nr:unnamed protein product [Timema californicum]
MDRLVQVFLPLVVAVLMLLRMDADAQGVVMTSRQKMAIMAYNVKNEKIRARPAGSSVWNDGLVCKESSDNPCRLMTTYAKDVYKSGFFYIGSTFYNDHRHPDNMDYSEVIRKWASEPGKGIGPLHIAKMEEVQLATLTFRLGYPYVGRRKQYQRVIKFLQVALPFHCTESPITL